MTAYASTAPVPIDTRPVRATAPTAPAVATRAHPTLRVAAHTSPMSTVPVAYSGFDGPTERIERAGAPEPRTRLVPRVSANDAPLPAVSHARMAVVLATALLALLGITLDAFGVVPQATTSHIVVVLVAALAVFATVAPHRTDVIAGRGLVAATVAFLVIDGVRLLTAHLLGSTGEMTFGRVSAGVGWQYLAPGAGLGAAFFVFAVAMGADRWRSGYAVLAAMVFVACPTWTLLMVTAALAPGGEVSLFPLNPATVVITLVGHLFFGLMLGLAFTRVRPSERSDGENDSTS